MQYLKYEVQTETHKQHLCHGATAIKASNNKQYNHLGIETIIIKGK